MESNPDISIESSTALLEGISKSIIERLDDRWTRKQLDDFNFGRLLKYASQAVSKGENVLEDSFVQTCSQLAISMGHLRSTRGDISKGRSVPKREQSNAKLSKLSLDMAESLAVYLLDSFFAGDSPYDTDSTQQDNKDEFASLKYDDYEEFNRFLDEENPIVGKVQYSVALFELYKEEYVIALGDYEEGLRESDEVTTEEENLESVAHSMLQALEDKIGLSPIHGTNNASRNADLIFVHGIGGGSQTTWAHEGNVENFWPSWIAEEFPELGVWTLGYGTNVSQWKERSMPLSDLGNQVLEELVVDGLGDRPIVFVTHSMGGIVVKQIINHARNQGVPRWKKIAEQTQGIAFLATPHSGANIASFAKFVSIVMNTSEQLGELNQHNARLRELHGAFLNFVKENKPVCRTYAERKEVKPGIKIFNKEVKLPKGIVVVDATSAEPNIPDERAIPLDEDHLSICKPKDKTSQVYKYVKSFLFECLESSAKATRKE